MTSKDEEKKEDSHVMTSGCPKSMNGYHKWIIKEGRSVCAHCQLLTTKQILLD